MLPTIAASADRPSSYAGRLESALAAGLARLPKDIIHRAIKFIFSKQHQHGGFCGRDVEPDLYYTSFALRTLQLTGTLDSHSLSPTMRWLSRIAPPLHTLIDLYSYGQALRILSQFDDPELHNRWHLLGQSLPSYLQRFYTDKGGYIGRCSDSRCSVYQTFVALLCYELADQLIPHAHHTATWLSAQQRSDGGFADTDLVPQSGTNPTAAALASWLMLESVSRPGLQAATGFLQSVYIPHSGFRANQRVPVPDLLSTFTALWTLLCFQSADFINPAALSEQISRLQQSNGGFCSCILDLYTRYQSPEEDSTDVEYTFYGLANLALLSLSM